MRWLFIIILLPLCVSCRYFETERISSNEVLEEELQAMDWSDIDTYPSFPACDGMMDKNQQRTCFETVILSSIQKQWAQGKWVVSHSLSDTLMLHLRVDTAGRVAVAPILLDSLLKVTLPKMDSLIQEGIRQLPKPTPAYKRGIPVQTAFTLPVVINTEEL